MLSPFEPSFLRRRRLLSHSLTIAFFYDQILARRASGEGKAQTETEKERKDCVGSDGRAIKPQRIREAPLGEHAEKPSIPGNLGLGLVLDLLCFKSGKACT